MPTKPPVLHEILAVEQDLKGNAERARTHALESFRSKQTHYTGLRRTFRPFAVEENAEDLAAERLEAETKLAKTVAGELDSALAIAGEAMTVGFQIDEANTRARADIVVDGETVASEVPATFLLQLERRLREVRSMFREAPTFDPVRLWTADPDADRPHVLRAEPVTTIRKARTRKYNLMVAATVEHPAQVDIVEIDEPVGEIRSYEWTGKLSIAKKTALLDQVDKLIAAVKQARSRANATPVDTERKVGKALTNFLLRPVHQ
ncbi:MAG: hypothetical protein KJO07_24425 [Deltaproteobacteria bacterium]|nr:hypothetical protein [Deltaproteobacteria bacterium]